MKKAAEGHPAAHRRGRALNPDWPATEASSLKYFFNVYLLFLRNRDGVWVGKGQREREGDTESETGPQALSCQHRA